MATGSDNTVLTVRSCGSDMVSISKQAALLTSSKYASYLSAVIFAAATASGVDSSSPKMRDVGRGGRVRCSLTISQTLFATSIPLSLPDHCV